MNKLRIPGLLMLVAVSFTASAQNVFSVQYENQADVKVFDDFVFIGTYLNRN